LSTLSLFTPVGIILVISNMSFIDDYTTNAQPTLTPGPLPGGDVRGFAGGKMPFLLLVLLIVGLIAIPYILKHH
jgi:hypothetical protein